MPDYFGSKLSWTISLVVSLIYFLLFVATVNGLVDDGLLFGFCVWGRPQLPDRENGCYHEPHNSHMYAFYVDLGLTAVVAWLYWWHENNKADKLQFLAIGGIILAHGLLHLFLFKGINCFISEADIPREVHVLGCILFGVFTFALSAIILSLGFVENNKGWIGVLLASVLVSALALTLSGDSDSKWFLPALFAVSHPLSSVTGLYSKSHAFSSKAGWAFLIATITGILELKTCLTFYRQIGGHVWYDLTLHIAVLLTLPTFHPVVTEADKKKKA